MLLSSHSPLVPFAGHPFSVVIRRTEAASRIASGMRPASLRVPCGAYPGVGSARPCQQARPTEESRGGAASDATTSPCDAGDDAVARCFEVLPAPRGVAGVD